MTYLPTKTWLTGDVLSAADLDAEFVGLRKYTHLIGTGDLKNAQFVDTQHIMPGVIDAQTTVTNNCSGIFGGQQHSWQALNYTFLTKYNTTRTSANVNNVVIPETSFTINIGRPATVLFSWWIQEQSRYDFHNQSALNYFVGTFNDINVVPNGIHKSVSQSTAQIIGAATFWPGLNISATNHLSGFAVVDGTALSFFMGLRGRSDSGQSQALSWGVNLELFYM
jgi:hypothetical protein